MFLSVIIPTYNRKTELATALQSLADQKMSRDQFEVLVINDGGETLTDLVDNFKNQLDIKRFFQKHAGASAARNLGIQEARGDVLVFFDDDAVAHKNWLVSIAEAMQGEFIVVGRVKALKRQFWAYFAPHYDQGEGVKVSSVILEGNLAVRRSVFDEAGVFDLKLDYGHEGQEWRQHLPEKYQVKYYPTVVIYHDYAFGLGNYLKKQFRFGEKSYYLSLKGHILKGDQNENALLESAPQLTRLLVKMVARLGSIFHRLGFYFGHFKFQEKK